MKTVRKQLLAFVLTAALLLGGAAPVFAASVNEQEAVDLVFAHIGDRFGTPQVPLSEIQAVPGYDDEMVIQYFVEVAMYGEYDGYRGYLMRYEKPITYYVMGEPYDEDILHLADLTAALNSIPGYPGISRVWDESQATIRIMFSDEVTYENYFGLNVPDNSWGYANCWYYTDPSILGEMSRTEIWISEDAWPRRDRNSVISEEFIQGQGMLNDPSYGFYSIFDQHRNDCDWPSALDWAVVRLLYDPRMERTASEAEIRRIAQEILDSWK